MFAGYVQFKLRQYDLALSSFFRCVEAQLYRPSAAMNMIALLHAAQVQSPQKKLMLPLAINCL